MKNQPEYFIGTSGWSYDDWIGKFYPRDIKRSEWIRFLAKYFNTVELNMSFYRFPFKNMLKGWRNKLPDGFQMTMKANRRITHYKKLKQVDDLLKQFYGLTSILEDRIGCILFQTPPSFKKTDQSIETLVSFLNIMDHEQKNVIEFRHSSWWDEEVYQILKKNKVAFCTVSGLNMVSDVVVTADFAYFRFHGPEEAYVSKYSEKELEQWAEKIKLTIEKSKLQQIYCYFNNDVEGHAVEDALKLKQFLGK